MNDDLTAASPWKSALMVRKTIRSSRLRLTRGSTTVLRADDAVHRISTTPSNAIRMRTAMAGEANGGYEAAGP